MSDIAIKVENLSKCYRIGLKEQVHDSLGGAIFSFLRQPLSNLRQLRRLTQFSPEDSNGKDIIWALKGLYFELKHGEVIGIIGRNGAGKSTLLKILSRITKPTSGQALINGRVVSLLEVGTGFHPELTGRENIYLNGTILGMSKAEVDRKFDEIVDFSGVEKFIDTPVKRYSSGMKVRLAFSVAAHLEPEILLIDEVLAVGDAAFQRKCLGKMGDVAGEGRTVLFVSHNMAAVAHLCERGILLEAGRLTCTGAIEKVIEKYQTAAAYGVARGTRDFDTRTGSGMIRFKEVAIVNGKEEPELYPGCAAIIKMVLDATENFCASHVLIGVGINGPLGERLVTLLNKFDPNARTSRCTIGPGTVVVCNLPKLLLSPGTYYLSLYIDINGEISDRIKDALRIEIHEANFYGTGTMPSISQGPFLLDQTWHYNTQ
jgi:lipopolysaccharide transport system ATP-binding protein